VEAELELGDPRKWVPPITTSDFANSTNIDTSSGHVDAIDMRQQSVDEMQ